MGEQRLWLLAHGENGKRSASQGAISQGHGAFLAYPWYRGDERAVIGIAAAPVYSTDRAVIGLSVPRGGEAGIDWRCGSVAPALGAVMDCERKGKWVRGCKFEPRYDLGPADMTGFESLRSASTSFFETLRKKTYRGDICVTCGELVIAPKPDS